MTVECDDGGIEQLDNVVIKGKALLILLGNVPEVHYVRSALPGSQKAYYISHETCNLMTHVRQDEIQIRSRSDRLQ